MKTRDILLSSLASAALISGAAFAQTTGGAIDNEDPAMSAPAAEGADGTLLLDNNGEDAADAVDGMDGTSDDPAMAQGSADAEAPTADPDMGVAADPGDVTTEDGTEDGTTVTEEANPPMGEGLYGAFAEALVSDLVGLNVLAATGETVGEVDQLVNVAGTPNAVVGVGGFLGLGERDVAIPLDRFSRTEDGLMLDVVGEEELDTMPEWDKSGEEMPMDMRVGDAL